MRNDIEVPPEDLDALDAPLLAADAPHKPVSTKPIPPPDDLKADVSLYDHPDLAPGGAGNFRLLAMIGVALIGAVLVVMWLLSGLMK
jgi:hypothetical protein